MRKGSIRRKFEESNVGDYRSGKIYRLSAIAISHYLLIQEGAWDVTPLLMSNGRNCFPNRLGYAQVRVKLKPVNEGDEDPTLRRSSLGIRLARDQLAKRLHGKFQRTMLLLKPSMEPFRAIELGTDHERYWIAAEGSTKAYGGGEFEMRSTATWIELPTCRTGPSHTGIPVRRTRLTDERATFTGNKVSFDGRSTSTDVDFGVSSTLKTCLVPPGGPGIPRRRCALQFRLVRGTRGCAYL